jgi:hypothetical protein
MDELDSPYTQVPGVTVPTEPEGAAPGSMAFLASFLPQALDDSEKEVARAAIASLAGHQP